ncbi:MAG: exodeoxyribonuclease III [Pyrinomonadaceae bacterium MAG19_C2-C3]|nr:exodeoxyribonuclease III [Pyrinomonadaceae bacterium MAG19_C2-C3]
MNIATWNVNSVTVRLPHVLRWLIERTPDVVCLQEIKCTDERFPREAFAEIGYHAATHGQRTYNGVAILSRTEARDVVRGFDVSGDDEDDFSDVQARLIAATIEGVRVVNVYVPNGARVGSEKYVYKLRWLERFKTFIETNYGRDENIVVCGDFNIAPDDRDVHNPAAWAGSVLVSEPEREALDELKEWGFTDSFRLHEKQAEYFSWWDYRSGDFRRNAGARIDHVLISDGLISRSVKTWIDVEPRRWERPSDHTPVIAELA